MSEPVHLVQNKINIRFLYGLIGNDASKEVGIFSKRLITDHNRSSCHHSSFQSCCDLLINTLIGSLDEYYNLILKRCLKPNRLEECLPFLARCANLLCTLEGNFLALVFLVHTNNKHWYILAHRQEDNICLSVLSSFLLGTRSNPSTDSFVSRNLPFPEERKIYITKVRVMKINKSKHFV